MGYNPNQPRDEEGEWTDGGGQKTPSKGTRSHHQKKSPFVQKLKKAALYTGGAILTAAATIATVRNMNDVTNEIIAQGDFEDAHHDAAKDAQYYHQQYMNKFKQPVYEGQDRKSKPRSKANPEAAGNPWKNNRRA